MKVETVIVPKKLQIRSFFGCSSARVHVDGKGRVWIYASLQGAEICLSQSNLFSLDYDRRALVAA